ncbi:alkaline phosphatase D family protein [Marinobacter lacisalsi]|uniref:Alkaline phosphatase D family protein n=1 Tax=Marinobacter lacisalsi TaxID=475979 RepID=A0ABV8QHN9_9GAMM
MTERPASAPYELPPIFAGPILRRTVENRLCLWLAGRPDLVFLVRVTCRDQFLVDRPLREEEVTALPVGRHATIWLLDVQLDERLPEGEWLHYDVWIRDRNSGWQGLRDWASHLSYGDSHLPRFVHHRSIGKLFHGSCRRPHHPSADGLRRVDRELRQAASPSDQPALLMLTGDQIYADDVAGPMLHAIHCVIRRLGLFQEDLDAADIHNSNELFDHPLGYYQRDQLLPESEFNEAVTEKFFGGVRKPVFTTASAGNHLISFSEVLAMYFLVWSPVPWQWVEGQPQLDNPELAQRYRAENETIERFREGLPEAARALANVPVYMIFDDHDITDDWNLSALWESTAYQHPFSRRIIGNALMAYLICQAWGNDPQRLLPLLEQVKPVLDPERGDDGLLNKTPHDTLIGKMLDFNSWHYTLPTSPKLMVLDTRTRRWRSELARSRPSGLMDWEGLTEFQHELLGESSVIVVSPAPMFGVKLIETIQMMFTWAGRPLTVDAENWMAHRGAANVLLNIFRHTGTPENFVILSGDVHYSFVYDVRLRQRPEAPRIWQITSSGIKNEFPDSLLDWLDRLNRWLYASRSPLNWFTKRRRMRIYPRLPSARSRGERLWNQAGIGEVCLSPDGQPETIRQLGSLGQDCRFDPGEINSPSSQTDQVHQPGYDQGSGER